MALASGRGRKDAGSGPLQPGAAASGAGPYELDTILEILDEALIGHLGFVAEGRPWVMPTMYARSGDLIYLHGSPASRMLKAAASELEVCLTVTLLDGLVLARSVFHHSMNYRSVVVSGAAQETTDTEQKMAAFEALVDHVIPGRWAEARHPSTKELKATKVLQLSLEHSSAKLRVGQPTDPEEDLQFPVWAGEIPLELLAGPLRPAPDLVGGILPPAYAVQYRRTRREDE